MTSASTTLASASATDAAFTTESRFGYSRAFSYFHGFDTWSENDQASVVHRLKDFGGSLEKTAIEGGKLVDKVLDNSYVMIEKKVPMPKWVFTSFALLSAIILLRYQRLFIH